MLFIFSLSETIINQPKKYICHNFTNIITPEIKSTNKS